MALAKVSVYDLRHYERQKGCPGQPPTLYGELTCRVLREILLGRRALEDMLVLTSPQERAWGTGRLVASPEAEMGHFDMRKMNWLESATTRLMDGGKELTELAGRFGVSVEQALMVLPQFASLVCDWTVEAFFGLTGAIADGEHQNVLMFSHGGQVDARAIFMKKFKAEPGMKPQNLKPMLDMRFLNGRCADTCEGYVYDLQVDTAAGLIERVFDVQRIELPAQFKALGGGALDRLLAG
ncbi:MAG: phosphoglycerate mutase family protein [Candidatus Magasanikbacteria bacterium]|nr:phosphoglycerate mutase family protein [Candidatus Magasanikbacteria bacterium]